MGSDHKRLLKNFLEALLVAAIFVVLFSFGFSDDPTEKFNLMKGFSIVGFFGILLSCYLLAKEIVHPYKTRDRNL